MTTHRQPWILNWWSDGLFILSPPFLCLLLVVLFPGFFHHSEVSVASWVILILLIDVAHVYTTLYRTYFDKHTFQQHKSLLVNIPLCCWVIGVILYELDFIIFWRVLAYLAVFHFIRQQYGFMKIYCRKDNSSKLSAGIDTFAVYYAAVYPLLHWHTNSQKNFTWFVPGDFWLFESKAVSQIGYYFYLGTLLIYVVKEVLNSLNGKPFNIPKNLIIAGTFLSWYFGIVYFNADLIFTTFNVVSHGIPYMALVWIFGHKKYHSPSNVTTNSLWKLTFKTYGVPVFLLIVFVFAYLEEGLWDALWWNDHGEVFPIFSFLPRVADNHLIALILPLLALPQISHYVIDGFIWKMSKDNYNWRTSTL